MDAVKQFDFPWLGELPKREKSKVGKALDVIKEMSALSQSKGVLVPPAFAAQLLGITKQRVHTLMQTGRLERVEFNGHPFIPEDSLLAFAREERRNGRPPKALSSVKEVWKASRAYAKEVTKETLK